MEHTIVSDTRILVDLDRIAGNMRAVRDMAGPGVAVAAVVKADAYGHGAVAVAPTLMENGAAMLAVANLKEALALKEAYPQYPVFIMGLTPDRLLPLVVEPRHHPDRGQPAPGPGAEPSGQRAGKICRHPHQV